MKAIFTIVGMRFRGTEGYVAALHPGAPLRLGREPHNEHDRRAVRVHDGSMMLGYVRATENTDLAEHIDAHGEFRDGDPGPSISGRFVVSGDRRPQVEIEQS